MSGTDRTSAKPSRTLHIAAVVIGVWLMLPLAVIVPISFSGEDSFRFPPQSWTLMRYANLADPVWYTAFLNSCFIAILSPAAITSWPAAGRRT